MQAGRGRRRVELEMGKLRRGRSGAAQRGGGAPNLENEDAAASACRDGGGAGVGRPAAVGPADGAGRRRRDHRGVEAAGRSREPTPPAADGVRRAGGDLRRPDRAWGYVASSNLWRAENVEESPFLQEFVLKGVEQGPQAKPGRGYALPCGAYGSRSSPCSRPADVEAAIPGSAWDLGTLDRWLQGAAAMPLPKPRPVRRPQPLTCKFPAGNRLRSAPPAPYTPAYTEDPTSVRGRHNEDDGEGPLRPGKLVPPASPPSGRARSWPAWAAPPPTRPPRRRTRRPATCKPSSAPSGPTPTRRA